jgi:hypothetical protein
VRLPHYLAFISPWGRNERISSTRREPDLPGRDHSERVVSNPHLEINSGLSVIRQESGPDSIAEAVSAIAQIKSVVTESAPVRYQSPNVWQENLTETVSETA